MDPMPHTGPVTVPGGDLAGPVEAPRTRRRRRSWVLDVSLAVIVGALSAGSMFAGEHHSPFAIRVLLLAALVVPLVLRRVLPIPVLAWILTLSTVAALAESRLGAPEAAAVALYTVIASGSRRRGVIAAGIAEGCILLAAIRLGSDALTIFIPLTAVNAAVLGLGLYTGARRALLAELRDRAARLERERDQQGELAAAAERARIAREMHDVVAHHLTVMVALSDGAAAASIADPSRAAEAMRAVSSTGRQALADTRRLLGVLAERDGDSEGSPSRVPLPGFAELGPLVDGVRAAGLPVVLEIRGRPDDLSSTLQATIYRLVQEALTNTLKHGGPGSSAQVRLDVGPGEVCLQVTDDGAGAAAPVPSGVGRGLAGMRERVRAFGGSVDAGPGPSGGWEVVARLPSDGSGRGDR
jgi:signal transduction histidine kinase